MNREYDVIIVGAGPAGFTDVLTGEGIYSNMARALKKPSKARDLASILCHQKSKMGLLF